MGSTEHSSSEANHSSGGRIGAIRVGVVVVIALGIVFRVARFMHRPTLWMDDAMLALNVMTRGFGELLQPLDLLQVAPVGFLWAQRALYLTGLHPESAFRVVPLLAGIVTLLIAPTVGRRIVHPTAGLLLAAALALSPALIRYSNEAKPYVLGPLVALFLIWCALRVLDRRPGATAALAGALFVAPLFVLEGVLLGAGAVAAIALQTREDQTSWKPVVALTTAWALGSGLSVALASDPTIVEAMMPYWSGAFMGVDHESRYYVATWFGRMAYLTLWDGFGFVDSPLWTPLLLILAGLGCVRLWRRERAFAVLVGLPLAVGLLASALGRYPLALRLWLWALPLLTLLALAGLYVVVRGTGKRSAILTAAACLLLIGASKGVRSLQSAYSPTLRGHGRPVIEELVRRRTPDEPVYVFARSAAVWNFYRFVDRGDATALPWLQQFMKLASPGGPAFENDTIMSDADPQQLGRLQNPMDPGTVLMGRSSGVHVREATVGRMVDEPDPNWAPVETSRFMASLPTGGCGWVFQLSVTRTAAPAFRDALEAAEAVVDIAISQGGSRALRVCSSGYSTEPPDAATSLPGGVSVETPSSLPGSVGASRAPKEGRAEAGPRSPS